MMSWDTRVALAYAAEELLVAAQALTSDLVPKDRGLKVAHSHLHDVLEHQHTLPPHIGRSLENLDARYSAREFAGATDPAGVQALTGETMAVLGRVRDLLAETEH